MGWFSKTPSKVSPVSEYKDEIHDNPSQYLEDLRPKFEDSEPSHTKQPTYTDAFKRLTLNDFTLESYISMPCFREAMLTGFQSMGVLGMVTFLIHKNLPRSANWSVCGFFLGSVVGWEQCRSMRKKSFQTVEAARMANQDKARRRNEETQDTDESFKQFHEMQKRQ